MVADLVAGIEVDKVAHMEVDMLANLVVDMEVYCAEIVWCKVYPTCVSSKLCGLFPILSLSTPINVGSIFVAYLSGAQPVLNSLWGWLEWVTRGWRGEWGCLSHLHKACPNWHSSPYLFWCAFFSLSALSEALVFITGYKIPPAATFPNFLIWCNPAHIYS